MTRIAAFFTALALCFLSPGARAADSAPATTAANPAPDPAPDPALCRALVKHTPDAGVAYQPGVDVHGRRVAPADISDGAQPMQMPQTITIPLTVSLAKVLNWNVGQYPYSQIGPGTETTLGTLTVTGDQVLFNGKPISPAQQDNLAVLCMKADRPQ